MGFLTGKTAVVTGASRGIGRGIACALARAGADLVVHATREEHLMEICAQAEGYGVRCVAAAGDAARSETAQLLVQTAVERLGRLDIAVSCAGINRDGMLHKLSDEAWERVLAVNLSGAFYLTRAAAQILRRQRSGRIINIGSVARRGNLGQANYAASKAGVTALTQTAALELGPFGVTCNAVCPGFIDTDMTLAVPAAARERILGRIPAGRSGRPGEVGDTVAFLASDQAAYVNGQIIDVSGGLIL
ncbi:beta-ketoacyl-ACP reductase [Oscillospiraceae bacterium]|nr:beta-ketoacyl-ACP reductase [Oscillospiraceae bacterium]BDF76617.1 beta-ketoacyl-ACP reductase [Oscillospiraceae bacterium]